jgi:hypothetical protein
MSSRWEKRMRGKRSQWKLRKVGVLVAHYLVENGLLWHHTHILSCAKTQIPLVVLPAKQNKMAFVSFIKYNNISSRGFS